MMQKLSVAFLNLSNKSRYFPQNTQLLKYVDTFRGTLKFTKMSKSFCMLVLTIAMMCFLISLTTAKPQNGEQRLIIMEEYNKHRHLTETGSESLLNMGDRGGQSERLSALQKLLEKIDD